MSSRTPQSQLRPTDALDLHQQDPAALGIHEGQTVRVESRYGHAELPARISLSVQAGQFFATFHDPQRAVSRLAGSARDARMGTPEYNVTAVRVTAVPFDSQ